MWRLLCKSFEMKTAVCFCKGAKRPPPGSPCCMKLRKYCLIFMKKELYVQQWFKTVWDFLFLLFCNIFLFEWKLFIRKWKERKIFFGGLWEKKKLVWNFSNTRPDFGWIIIELTIYRCETSMWQTMEVPWQVWQFYKICSQKSNFRQIS